MTDKTSPTPQTRQPRMDKAFDNASNLFRQLSISKVLANGDDNSEAAAEPQPPSGQHAASLDGNRLGFDAMMDGADVNFNMEQVSSGASYSGTTPGSPSSCYPH